MYAKLKEWSEIVPMACAAYNFFPNEHSRESPFFLMFGRDPRIPLTELLTPRVQIPGYRRMYSFARSINRNISSGSTKS